MVAKWIKARQTKYSAYAVVYIAVVIGVLGLANFLADRYNKSYDATANKQFSLSDQTIKVTKNLKSDVKINYFGEQSQFPQARDLFGRYQNLSPRVKVEYIDPVKRPQQARAAGFRRDLTILVDSGLRKEEAKTLSEEEVTGALIRSLKSGERNACFVSGSGEHSIDDTGRSGYSAAKEALERNNYKTRSINLIAGGAAAAPKLESKSAPKGDAAPAASGKPEVPKDCTVVIVGGPRYNYEQPEVDALKNYVEGGGHALLLVDPPLSMGRDDTAPNDALVGVVAGWGVTLNKDLALDTSGIGQIFGLGPEVPLVATYESHAIVREMKDVATGFPIARTLDVKNGDKTTVEKLFSTSDNSYATSNLNSQRIAINPKTDKKGPLALAAAGTYNGQQQGRFVVVGSALWLGNNFIRFNGNRDLFLNMINWLTADEDLISIRPKEPEDRRLDISGQKMNMLFWLSVVFFPLAVVSAGLATWWKRR